MVTNSDILKIDAAYCAKTYKRAPVVLDRGEGVYLYDLEGRKLLDFGSGIAVNALGHSHPVISKAIASQVARIMHTSNGFCTEPMVNLAKLLCESCFADRVFFTNSGTEAIEGAIKFTRNWFYKKGQARTGIVAFEGAFHGRTFGAMSLTHKDKYRAPFQPLMAGVQFAPWNNLSAARNLVTKNTGAVILEPIQGEGGIKPASDEFLRGLREMCDAHGALLIFDEIQSGVGRTGKLWAHEWSGVMPDIMVAAKPLGGGLPMGAVLLRADIADAMAIGEHGSTFSGNALVAEAGRAAFEFINRPKFLSGVVSVGESLAKALCGLRDLFPGVVGDIRGRGLMWGVDVKKPAPQLVEEALRHDLVILGAGDYTLRILPALICQPEHVFEFHDKMKLVFEKFA